MAEKRYYFMKKLLTICPICGKKIHGRDRDIYKLQNESIKSWPVRYVHFYNHGIEFHAITMQLDSYFAVRGKQIADCIKTEKI
jgi:hypothetical protein